MMIIGNSSGETSVLTHKPYFIVWLYCVMFSGIHKLHNITYGKVSFVHFTNVAEIIQVSSSFIWTANSKHSQLSLQRDVVFSI